MTRITRVIALASIVWLVPSVLAAHHGVANFDLNTELEITGAVRRIAFVNPHSWLYLDVTGEDGQTRPWKCELRGATVLKRSGWSPEMFAPGTRVTITGKEDDPKRATHGRVIERTEVINQKGEVVLAADHIYIVERRPADA